LQRYNLFSIPQPFFSKNFSPSAFSPSLPPSYR